MTTDPDDGVLRIINNCSQPSLKSFAMRISPDDANRIAKIATELEVSRSAAARILMVAGFDRVTAAIERRKENANKTVADVNNPEAASC